MQPTVVTDAGMETDLIFHRGIDLPEFAAFPLLDSAPGRQALRDYYAAFAEIAARHQLALSLESPTWRANPDWGARLGYDAPALARVNADAMSFLSALADEYAVPVTLVGMIGPRGDGYVSDGPVDPIAAHRYHAPQVAALVNGGAQQVTAYTLTEVGEAVGITRAAREVGVPVAVGFTVETDGRLPSGMTLGDAIARVDEDAPPDSYLVNCAHPRHIAAGLSAEASWLGRIEGVRVNASQLSHAELDESEALDEGDIGSLAREVVGLIDLLPNLRLVGGCCGTDARHVATMWEMLQPG
ncbi:MAG: homocysteine S-methyltransferase family protein [Actinobacteria bacterium]|uniref:Homocysteine S-methyltransferase family protein n=1 Tax=Nostocoides veronense TaxID=330836 RepID=A0ABN2M029_9MICO|nr:homocysteine S-methyltransferase family protein [Actinomycetota bacterium]